MSEEGKQQQEEIRINQMYDFITSPGWPHIRNIFLNKIIEFDSTDIIDKDKGSIEVQVCAAQHIKAALKDILAEIEGVKDTKKYEQELLTKRFDNESHILNLGDEESQ